ncbi:C-type lectin domain family 10 member A-like [Strongylocentrotus purpuratus]|uniref:Uncharacterized protein n=1 Tax=Strongylocentrotus purpuratus TaxID=7668 RepID=A0A7M7T313_STRPU|nr:C-type lectin domain family 10 member A-like [Strongylocentrotus purpuratus]
MSPTTIGCARPSIVLCRIPDCLAGLCSHGDCTETLTGYSCRCQNDWTGNLCDIEADMTLSDNTDLSSTPESPTTPADREKENSRQVSSTAEAGSGQGGDSSATVSPDAASEPSQITSIPEATVDQVEGASSTKGPEEDPDTNTARTESVGQADPAETTTSQMVSSQEKPEVSQTSSSDSQETPEVSQTSSSDSPSTSGLNAMTPTTSLQTESCSPSPVSYCPDDWITQQGEINKCYKLIGMESNWQASRQACCELSATMLVIDSLIENEFIEDTFGSSGEVDTWLGCHNVDGDNDRWSCMKSTSTWVRNEDQSGYWRWETEWPDETASGSRCAFIELSKDSLWKDTDCNESYRTICQMILLQDQSSTEEAVGVEEEGGDEEEEEEGKR